MTVHGGDDATTVHGCGDATTATAAIDHERVGDALRGIAEELKCCVCLGLLSNPQSTPCQHTFCYDCIIQSLPRSKNRCPLCKSQVTRRALVPNELLNDMASKFGVMRQLYEGMFDVGLSQYPVRRQWSADPVINLSQLYPQPDKAAAKRATASTRSSPTIHASTSQEEAGPSMRRGMHATDLPTALTSTITREALSPLSTTSTAPEFNVHISGTTGATTTTRSSGGTVISVPANVPCPPNSEEHRIQLRRRNSLQSEAPVLATQPSELNDMMMLEQSPIITRNLLADVDHKKSDDDNGTDVNRVDEAGSASEDDGLPFSLGSALDSGGEFADLSTQNLVRIEALKLQLRGQLAAIDEEIERQHQSDERSRAATPENVISPYIIAWSGLDAVRMHELRTAVETLGDNSSRLSASINEATHLVVDLEDRSMMAARRTLKYFEAVLRGLWIVSDEWVSASVAECKWLPPDAFEVHGDTFFPEYGPQRARLALQSHSQSHKLFTGLSFQLVGNFDTVPRSTVENFIRLGGGSLLSVGSTSSPIVLSGLMGSDEDEGAVDELKQMTAREQQSILSLTWLLDSISAFRLMDRELYIL